MAISRIILTVTEELWITLVTAVPRSTARKGLSSPARALTTSCDSLSELMEELMVDRPIKRTPKPRIISPIFLAVSFLMKLTMTTPISTNSGAILDKLNDTSCEVTVVPILAPKITPAA